MQAGDHPAPARAGRLTVELHWKEHERCFMDPGSMRFGRRLWIVPTGMEIPFDERNTEIRLDPGTQDGAALTNVLVAVTRYFGGTKLGKGGLARAYREAAKAVLRDAPRCRAVPHGSVMGLGRTARLRAPPRDGHYGRRRLAAFERLR